jgi:hypothetical protein
VKQVNSENLSAERCIVQRNKVYSTEFLKHVKLFWCDAPIKVDARFASSNSAHAGRINNPFLIGELSDGNLFLLPMLD